MYIVTKETVVEAPGIPKKQSTFIKRRARNCLFLLSLIKSLHEPGAKQTMLAATSLTP